MSVDSDTKYFLIPEFGLQPNGPRPGLGVTVYGNGGMNTDYAGGRSIGNGTANMLCGQGELGVDLMQLIIAPTVAFKIGPQPFHRYFAVARLSGASRRMAFTLLP